MLLDAIDADAIGVKAIEPEVRRGEQEAAHLKAAVVEDVRLPIGVKATTWILVLEEVRAVEEGEAMRIVREVRGGPIEDHADAPLMQVIDQVHEVFRLAVAVRGREVAGDLVAPASVEGVLHHRQEFDMREAMLEHVLGKPWSKLAVAQRAPTFVGHARKASQVYFIDGYG